jgi:hypothetical protein
MFAIFVVIRVIVALCGRVELGFDALCTQSDRRRDQRRASRVSVRDEIVVRVTTVNADRWEDLKPKGMPVEIQYSDA